MMVIEKRFRIIKRTERQESQAAQTEKAKAYTRNSTDGAKREAVTVVDGWVRELRLKRVAEAARGFESLFSQTAAGATRG